METTHEAVQKPGLILACWRSYRALPLWVQIWTALILMPMNLASLTFLQQDGGVLVAILAISAMILNLPVLIRDRGFSKFMAVPHLIPWTVLVIYLVGWRPEGDATYTLYLQALVITNVIALAFDYVDAVAWLKGNRKVA